MIVLRLGSSGDEVRQLERKLKELGLYSGAIDGAFGGGVQAGVKSFQASHGLKADGVVGAKTWALLFPDASPPSDKAPQRLVQMKALLGQLAAYEVGRTGSRYELRLMPRPLHRYNDDKAKVVDGAIFAFAYGTNPELLAVIEARGSAASAQWQIGFARCGTAEQHVLLKAKEIYTLPYAKTTDAKDSYWNFSYTFKKTE